MVAGRPRAGAPEHVRLLHGNLLALGAHGKLTLPALVEVNHWALIVPLVLMGGGALIWLDRQGK